MDGTVRAAIGRGALVSIVQKSDQGTGRRTEGIVRDILTGSATHPHGIKVRLETGEVGRVKECRQERPREILADGSPGRSPRHSS